MQKTNESPQSNLTNAYQHDNDTHANPIRTPRVSNQYDTYLTGREQMWSKPNDKNALPITGVSGSEQLARDYVPFQVQDRYKGDRSVNDYYLLNSRSPKFYGWVKADGAYRFGSKALLNKTLDSYYRHSSIRNVLRAERNGDFNTLADEKITARQWKKALASLDALPKGDRNNRNKRVRHQHHAKWISPMLKVRRSIRRKYHSSYIKHNEEFYIPGTGTTAYLKASLPNKKLDQLWSKPVGYPKAFEASIDTKNASNKYLVGKAVPITSFNGTRQLADSYEPFKVLRVISLNNPKDYKLPGDFTGWALIREDDQPNLMGWVTDNNLYNIDPVHGHGVKYFGK